MDLIRFILTFSLITLLLLLSQSLPTSAAGDGGGKGAVLIPFRRLLLSQPVKAGEKVGADGHVDDPTSDQPEKLGIHMRKVRGGGGGTRARGKTSSAVRTQLASFHFASVLGCSLFLVCVILL